MTVHTTQACIMETSQATGNTCQMLSTCVKCWTYVNIWSCVIWIWTCVKCCQMCCVNFLTLFTCEKELQIVSQYSSNRNLLLAKYVPDIILWYIYGRFKPLFPVPPTRVHKACRTSMTRDRTYAPCIGSRESQPLDCQKIPTDGFLIVTVYMDRDSF